LSNRTLGALRKGPYKLIETRSPLPDSHSLFTWPSAPVREAGTQLYDLARDPEEKHDLTVEEPEKMVELVLELDSWMQSRCVDPSPSTEPLEDPLRQALKERGYWEVVTAGE